MRLLLVEDEKTISHVIKLNLELDGFEIVLAETGKKALELFDGQHFDLIILDIMLPEMNGIDVCQRVRITNRDIPIIMVSAKDTGSDRINGLKAGADDYLVKPFEMEELTIRIQKLLNRSNPELIKVRGQFEFGTNVIYFDKYTAETKNGDVKLSEKEAKLLRLFIDKNGEVISRQEILQKVWEYDVYPSTRTIDNFILAFRKYFEPDPKKPVHFHSIRSVGYKFTC